MHPANDIEETLHDLEMKLSSPETRRSPDELSALLSDDFLEFGCSGQIYDKAAVIPTLLSESTADIGLTDFKAARLSPNVALVTHRTIHRSDDQPLRLALRSSIWVLSNGNWRILFHQGTPIRA